MSEENLARRVFPAIALAIAGLVILASSALAQSEIATADQLPDPGSLPRSGFFLNLPYRFKRLRENVTLTLIRDPEQKAIRDSEYAERRLAESAELIAEGGNSELIEATLNEYENHAEGTLSHIDSEIASGQVSAETAAKISLRAEDHAEIAADLATTLPENLAEKVGDDLEGVVLASGPLRDLEADSKGEAAITPEMSEGLAQLRASGLISDAELTDLTENVTSRSQLHRKMIGLHKSGKIPALEIYQRFDVERFNEGPGSDLFKKFMAGQQLDYFKNTTAALTAVQPSEAEQTQISQYFADRAKNPGLPPPAGIAKFVSPQLYLGNAARYFGTSLKDINQDAFVNEQDRALFEDLRAKFTGFRPEESTKFAQIALSTVQGKLFEGKLNFSEGAVPVGFRPEEFSQFVKEQFHKPEAYAELRARFSEGGFPGAPGSQPGQPQGQPFQLGAPPAWVKFDVIENYPFDPALEKKYRDEVQSKYQGEFDKKLADPEYRKQYENRQQESHEQFKAQEERFKAERQKWEGQNTLKDQPQPYGGPQPSSSQTSQPTEQPQPQSAPAPEQTQTTQPSQTQTQPSTQPSYTPPPTTSSGSSTTPTSSSGSTSGTSYQAPTTSSGSTSTSSSDHEATCRTRLGFPAAPITLTSEQKFQVDNCLKSL